MSREIDSAKNNRTTNSKNSETSSSTTTSASTINVDGGDGNVHNEYEICVEEENYLEHYDAQCEAECNAAFKIF